FTGDIYLSIEKSNPHVDNHIVYQELKWVGRVNEIGHLNFAHHYHQEGGGEESKLQSFNGYPYFPPPFLTGDALYSILCHSSTSLYRSKFSASSNRVEGNTLFFFF
ncbi:hypothetical protein HMI54_013601, partial [Coelomomyces lativittatus]